MTGSANGAGKGAVTRAAPLDGLTVLEISSFVAAPLGGMTLAQLGAEVIRIDPIGGGGPTRPGGRWRRRAPVSTGPA